MATKYVPDSEQVDAPVFHTASIERWTRAYRVKLEVKYLTKERVHWARAKTWLGSGTLFEVTYTDVSLPKLLGRIVTTVSRKKGWKP